MNGEAINPAAIDPLPFFITPPGGTDVMFNVMAVVVLLIIMLLGSLYFQLHALPERMAHSANKTQMQLVAVLALIALFTHQHIYWIAALLLALIQFPDFRTPVVSIAESLERIAGRYDRRPAQPPLPAPVEEPVVAASPAQEPGPLAAAAHNQGGGHD